MREMFLGEPVPATLGMLEHMADPGLDRDALSRAFALDDPAAGAVVGLHLVAGLVGNGHAQAVTCCDVSRRQGDEHRVLIEWLEPHVYDNAEPGRRRIEGTWRDARSR